MRRDETTTPIPYGESGQYIRDLLLAGADDIVQRLALAAVGAIEQRRTLADTLRAALDRLHEQQVTIDRLREDNRRLHHELRRAEAERRPEAA